MLLFALTILSISCPFVIGYDIVIYAATPSGIAAAISSARASSLSVALIEPTAHIGGMATAGGIGLSDTHLAVVRTFCFLFFFFDISFY